MCLPLGFQGGAPCRDPELSPEKRVLERKLKKERKKEERKRLREAGAAAAGSPRAPRSAAQLALDYLCRWGAGGGAGRGRPHGAVLPQGRWPPACACLLASPRLVSGGLRSAEMAVPPAGTAGLYRPAASAGGSPLCGVRCAACHRAAGLEPSRWQATPFHPLTRTRGPLRSTQGTPPGTRQRLACACCKYGGHSPAQESSGAPGSEAPVKSLVSVCRDTGGRSHPVMSQHRAPPGSPTPSKPYCRLPRPGRWAPGGPPWTPVSPSCGDLGNSVAETNSHTLFPR